MTENMAVRQFHHYPGIDFLNRDCLKTLHQILDIKVNSSAANCPDKRTRSSSIQHLEE